MAKYTNPLDEFQTHSIHYVILAARSTDELRNFTDTSDIGMSASLQAIDNAKQLGDQVKIPGKTGDSVYLMLDSRRFSQFSITDFSLKTIAAGFADPSTGSPNSVGQELVFTILDNMGISFANFLQYITDKKLQVSFEGMAILIRVLFVGSNSKGETKLIQSTSIPALFKEIEVDLTDTKGLYHCQCIPLIGMVSTTVRNQQWTSIGTASQYFSGLGANTLGAIVNSFEARLNDESFKRYAQYNAQIPGADKNKVTRFGRPVEYMITLPKSWAEFTFSGPSQGGATEIDFRKLLKSEEEKNSRTALEQQKRAQTNSVAAGKDSHLTVHPELTVTQVLDKIFSQTVEVAKLGNFSKVQDQANEIKFYKHLVSVTSDDFSYTVHIDVVEYIVPNAELKTQTGAALNANDNLLFEEIQDNGKKIKVPRNFLEFDYIFSGKNLDVITLDLKIEKFNLMLTQANRLGQANLNSTADAGQKQTDGQGIASDVRTVQGMAAKDPVLIPRRTGDERTNFSNLSANLSSEGDTPQAIRQQYIRNISELYYGGSVRAKMTIRGNPFLLDRVALSSIPQHVKSLTITDEAGISSSSNTSVKAEYRRNFEADLLKMEPRLSQTANGGFKVNSLLQGPSHAVSPVFIKVNVFGPNVDFITNEINSAIYADRLFYNRYYYMFTMVSKIEGTRFTHEFELSPYNVYGAYNITAQAQNTSTVKQI